MGSMVEFSSAHLRLYCVQFSILGSSQKWPSLAPKILCYCKLYSKLYYIRSTAVEVGGVQPSNSVEQHELPHFYFKIPYIRPFSGITQHRVHKLFIRFCKLIDMMLVFLPLKLRTCLM